MVILLIFGFIVLVVSQAFTACVETSPNAEFTCSTVLLICFGVPIVIGAIPLICLKVKNRFTTIVLYIYSAIIVLIFMPIGTVIGGHTIYYLINYNKNA